MTLFETIDSLGLETEAAATLRDAMEKASFYRKTLYGLGIHPTTVELILNVKDLGEVDTTQADILAEKARIEWADFIPANKR